MPYVSERWLGGTLTNFREIRKRIGAELRAVWNAATLPKAEAAKPKKKRRK